MPSPPVPQSDLDLLTLARRWTGDLSSPPTEDERARDVRILVAASPSDWCILPGSRLPAAVLTRVQAALEGSSPGPEPPGPEVLDAVRTAVPDRAGPRIEGGPVYVFGPPTTPRRPDADLTIVTSAAADATDAADALERPVNWDPGEWADLLAGRIGPWAAAVDHGGRVLSLTHTPRPLLDVAAECGVWTDPSHRGRGLAPHVTAAWAELVRGPGRHLFYSCDHRNTASQGVARRLGLRHLGWQWTISAEPWTDGDAWGMALSDHLRGGWTPTPELETDAHEVGDAMHPEWFFRTFDQWDWWDRELVALAAQGPALDLGAGAGRTSLWLQEQGIDVTAVDSSPRAVKVCRARGVADARLGDLNEPPSDKAWRAIFLLCGNLGLGGSFEGNRRLLTRLAELAAPDAVLVGDTVEPFREPEIGLRIRYRGVATPWWRQRNIPVAEIPALVEGTGWVVDRHVVDLPDHAVLLRREARA
jgi:hypothetical protein